MPSVRGFLVSAALIVVLLFGGRTATAQVHPPEPPPHTSASLRAFLLHPPGEPPRPEEQVGASRRSIPLAFTLSAVVPGAGQVYNRHWVKAGVAAAIEVLTIAGYVSWQRQGSDAEEVYIAYAHQRWSPVAYASWLNTFKDYLNDRFPGRSITAPDVQPLSGVDFANPEAWTAAERQAVRDMFSQIRAIEEQAFHPETGASFSHKLPYFGEQQYYELIGKYYQFAPGWAEYPDYLLNDGTINEDVIDPNETAPNDVTQHPNVPAEFYDYARDHARANDLLRRAQRISALIILNHLVAAADAAIFAKIHNDRISARIAFVTVPGSAPQPVPVLQVRL